MGYYVGCSQKKVNKCHRCKKEIGIDTCLVNEVDDLRGSVIINYSFCKECAKEFLTLQEKYIHLIKNKLWTSEE